MILSSLTWFIRCGWTSGKTSTFQSIQEQERQRKETCLSNFPIFRKQTKCMLWAQSSSSWNQEEEVERGPEVQIFSVVLGNDISRESGVTHKLYINIEVDCNHTAFIDGRRKAVYQWFSSRCLYTTCTWVRCEVRRVIAVWIQWAGKQDRRWGDLKWKIGQNPYTLSGWDDLLPWVRG